MARNRKGPPRQAEHFGHDDHEHAAHKEEASPGRGAARDTKKPARKTSHPVQSTPKGPSRGQ
jgi:hypothetical protein